MTRASSRRRQAKPSMAASPKKKWNGKDKWWCPLCQQVLNLKAGDIVPKHSRSVKGRRHTCPTSKMKATETT